MRSWLRTTAGIGFVLAGAAWESLFGPSIIGWGLILAGLAAQWWTAGRTWRRTPLDWPLLLLLLTLGVSYWVTTDKAVTAAAVNATVVGIVALHAVANWALTRNRLAQTAVALSLIGGGLALVAPVAVAWHESKSGLIPDALYDRLPLLLPDPVHPNVMAALMLMLAPIPLAYLFTLWGRRLATNFLQGTSEPALFTGYRLPFTGYHLPIPAALIGGAMLFVLLLTRSRGGYLVGAVGVVLLLWLTQRRRLAALAAAFAAMAGGYLAWAGTQAAPETVDALTDTTTLAFRQTVWETAVWMIGDFSFTGVGMGTFNDVATRLYPFPPVSSPGAHNLYLQIGVDLGIPGLIAFLAIFLTTLSLGWTAVRHARTHHDPWLSPLSIGLWVGLVSMGLHGLVDLTVWGTRMAFLPWLLIAAMLSVYLQLKE